MKHTLWILGCVLLSGCVGEPPPLVNQEKVSVSRLVNGRITVEGAPGAVAIPGASTVTLVVLRAAKYTRKVLHLGEDELPIASVSALVKPDGSFERVTLGEAGVPIFPDDELILTPYQDVRQVGYMVMMFVPMR